MVMLIKPLQKYLIERKRRSLVRDTVSFKAKHKEMMPSLATLAAVKHY